MSSAPPRPVRWLAAVADLVWPVACGGCEATGERWCPGCAALLAGPAFATSPTPRPAHLPPVWAVTAYDGPVRAAVVAWKDEGRHDLTRPLGAGLISSVLAALAALAAGEAREALVRRDEPVWLVPMPSRPAARRARGGDPVRELALRAAAGARRAGWAVNVLPALRHVRAVADQSGLDAAARSANVHGAFDVRPAARGLLTAGPCLLVDDVVTTGATLAEAAAVIEHAGGHPFGAAVVAATRRTGAGRVTGASPRV